jgi:hypothetical protein
MLRNGSAYDIVDATIQQKAIVDGRHSNIRLQREGITRIDSNLINQCVPTGLSPPSHPMIHEVIFEQEKCLELNTGDYNSCFPLSE